MKNLLKHFIKGKGHKEHIDTDAFGLNLIINPPKPMTPTQAVMAKPIHTSSFSTTPTIRSTTPKIGSIKMPMPNKPTIAYKNRDFNDPYRKINTEAKIQVLRDRGILTTPTRTVRTVSNTPTNSLLR